jgi:hypothetical protein
MDAMEKDRLLLPRIEPLFLGHPTHILLITIPIDLSRFVKGEDSRRSVN